MDGKRKTRTTSTRRGGRLARWVAALALGALAVVVFLPALVNGQVNRIARALMARGVVPAAVLGFSLGQVSALAVSGMLSEEETYRFVKVRAEFMAEASSAHAGVMSALLKAHDEAVRAVCESCAQGDVLVPAN